MSGAAGSGQPAGAGDAELGGAAGATDACNDLDADAPDYSFTSDPGPPPEANGGELASGTYFLTEEILYDADFTIGDDLGSVKVVIDGHRWQEVDGWPPGSTIGADVRVSGTFSTSGAFLTLELTCPEAYSRSVEYTADATSFTFYGVDHGLPYGIVFTRQ